MTTSPMSHLDGCPECVYGTELPKSWAPTTDGYQTAYLCSDCGHAWTTDWKDEEVGRLPLRARRNEGDVWENGANKRRPPGGALTPSLPGASPMIGASTDG